MGKHVENNDWKRTPLILIKSHFKKGINFNYINPSEIGIKTWRSSRAPFIQYHSAS